MNSFNKPTITFTRLDEDYDPNISNECNEDIKDFISLLNSIELKNENYHSDLNSFYQPVYKFAHEKLNKYGFLHNKPELNIDNIEVKFWLRLYREIDCSQYSPFYNDVNENVARHNISAFARNYCLKKEIEYFFIARVSNTNE